MNQKLRISLLSTVDAPLLGYTLQEFLKAGIAIDSLILDAAPLSEKDRAIHEERTAGKLPPVPFSEIEKLKIPAWRVQSHSSEETANLVREKKIDLLVNAGTPRILKSHILSAPTRGVINCHPGLLPEFRGCTCVEWAVFLDEQVGNTVHFMTEGIDEGPIVLKEGLRFSKSDSYVDVRVKVYQHGMELLVRGIERILEEDLSAERAERQKEGRYFKVIEPEKMREVFRKLEEGRYAFQF